MDRRSFLYTTATSTAWVLSSCKNAVDVSTTTQTDTVLHDKLRGMIVLGAYGDALGALHEPSGLQGTTGDPARARSLSPFATYQPPGATGAPWWVWVDGSNETAHLKGIPTDDTAFRLFILQPWLRAFSGQHPTEDDLETWMLHHNQQPVSSSVPLWHSRRRAQIQDWLVMFNDARRWEDHQRDNVSATTAFNITPGNPFFRPQIPVVFGMFMYMELAALYAHCPPEAVMQTFSSFCSLDQGYARIATGLFAGLMAAAVRSQSDPATFAPWFKRQVTFLLNTTLLGSADNNQADRITFLEAFNASWTWGITQRKHSEAEFLTAFKQSIYEASLPGTRDADGFRVFDPLLFFRQITATIAYTDGLLPQALSLLASSPGDADTIPSMLGTLAGAWYGFDALKALPAISEDLSVLEQTLQTVFGYDTITSVHDMASLSRRISC